MSEVTVMFFKVDDEAIERIAKYYESNASEKGDFYSTVLGVDNYQNGNDNDFLGSPTQISACFKHGMPSFLDNVDEYIRRRELIENE